jgi:beta-phosphoglucomutase
MDRMPYAALLFDMDGVILDSMGQHTEAWQEVLAQVGWQVDKDFILQNEGALGSRVLKELAQTNNYPIPSIGEFKSWMISLFRQQSDLYLQKHAPKVRPYAWSKPTLDALMQARIPFALVTSSSQSMIKTCLDPELAQCFSVIISRDDVDHYKPHPEPYLNAAAALGVDPRACLAVENAPAGIQSARQAGATCFALTTTLSAHHLNHANQVGGQGGG